MRKFLFCISLSLLILAAGPVWALSINIASGSGSLDYVNATTAGTQADPWVIDETLTTPITLVFGTESGSPLGQNTTGTGHAYGKWISKTVTNNTGNVWTSFELELQVTLGIPSGQGDGLSFADGSSIISSFVSDVFSSYTRIDDTRDYLNFSGGTVNPGQSVNFLFAITDNQTNNPFFLLETPNKVDAPVPEPATMLLLGGGLAGLAGLRRKFKK